MERTKRRTGPHAGTSRPMGPRPERGTGNLHAGELSRHVLKLDSYPGSLQCRPQCCDRERRRTADRRDAGLCCACSVPVQPLCASSVDPGATSGLSARTATVPSASTSLDAPHCAGPGHARAAAVPNPDRVQPLTPRNSSTHVPGRAVYAYRCTRHMDAGRPILAAWRVARSVTTRCAALPAGAPS